MKAMRLHAAHAPLREETVAEPRPTPGEVLIKVSACGVCRTDLHLVDGELPQCSSPVTPGHEIVGTVVRSGSAQGRWKEGSRVGVPWLAWTCGECLDCRAGRENLCPRARFTGCHVDGGYAEYTIADERFCLALPERYGDEQAAPLLCAGLIGYRSYLKAGDAKNLGIYGFGAAAHILAQVAHAEGRSVFAFTRSNDLEGQRFARSFGAQWAGGSDESPPEPLDAAIVFAPVGALVVAALKSVRKGGAVICGGIHMSDIPSFPYDLLWGERRIESVANLTREDGERFLELAGKIPIRIETTLLPLARANEALAALREGKLSGAAVLRP